MYYGYIDESGTEDSANWLMVSLVIFDSKIKVDKLARRFKELRIELGLPNDYEFHRTHNKLKIRRAVEKEILEHDFIFLNFAIKKTSKRDAVRYEIIAKILVRELQKLVDEVTVLIDENPVLLKKLKKMSKEAEAKKIKFRPVNSKQHDAVQLADYLVNISIHRLTGKLVVERYEKLFQRPLIEYRLEYDRLK